MSKTKEIHLGDIGTAMQVTIEEDGVPVDVSTATTKQVKLKKPDGTVITGAASFVNTGTDGKIEYLTQASDLDATGYWEIQGRVVMPTGTWSTKKGDFEVFPNL